MCLGHESAGNVHAGKKCPAVEARSPKPIWLTRRARQYSRFGCDTSSTWTGSRDGAWSNLWKMFVL
jgi:hypothetical protein